MKKLTLEDKLDALARIADDGDLAQRLLALAAIKIHNDSSNKAEVINWRTEIASELADVLGYTAIAYARGVEDATSELLHEIVNLVDLAFKQLRMIPPVPSCPSKHIE